MVESKTKKGSVSSKEIGKISPLKKIKSEQKSKDSSFEISLLNSLQIFLRYHGIERSHASIEILQMFRMDLITIKRQFRLWRIWNFLK